jgi:hypothetical protein
MIHTNLARKIITLCLATSLILSITSCKREDIKSLAPEMASLNQPAVDKVNSWLDNMVENDHLY